MALKEGSSRSEHSEARGRSVFATMAKAMLLFGVLVGVLFPPFAANVLRIQGAYSLSFWLFSVAAGVAVGLANFSLVYGILGRQVRVMVAAMSGVNDRVNLAERSGVACTDDCRLEVTSNDAIGQVQRAFNEMAESVMVRLEVETRIREMLEELSQRPDLQHVGGVTIRHLVRACSAAAGVLYVLDGHSNGLAGSVGFDPSELPARIDNDWGPVMEVLDRGETAVLSVEEHALSWAKLTTPLGELQPHTLTLIPLQVQGRTVGIAVVASSAACITSVSKQLIEAFRSQSAPYIQNAILHQKLQTMAAIDELTGVLNRRFGMRRLNEEFARASRHGSPLSVLMLDIDHFKKFNDTYGHEAGDEVLRVVARTIDEQSRSGDVVFRYGGEEFVLVAPGAASEDAAVLAERVRRLVETTQVEWRQHKLQVTASVGYANMKVTGAGRPDDLLSLADEALYAAKHGGRNVVAERMADGTRLVSSSVN